MERLVNLIVISNKFLHAGLVQNIECLRVTGWEKMCLQSKHREYHIGVSNYSVIIVQGCKQYINAQAVGNAELAKRFMYDASNYPNLSFRAWHINLFSLCLHSTAGLPLQFSRMAADRHNLKGPGEITPLSGLALEIMSIYHHVRGLKWRLCRRSTHRKKTNRYITNEMIH